jgi:hypothetical protein
MVEDLVDLLRPTDRNVDRVAVSDRVQGECVVQGFRAELTPGLPLWIEVVNGQPADPGGEPLVQPKLSE